MFCANVGRATKVLDRVWAPIKVPIWSPIWTSIRTPKAPTGTRCITSKKGSPSKLRNIGIIAHIDAGKTTTTERMLYYSGLTKHIGDVDQGDTVMDYLPAERDRGITINSAAITFNWNDHKINLIDTPGHADFTFEVIRSIRVLDGVVTILDAVAGVEAQTEKVWRQAKQMGIPKLVYVNKMDREGAGFGRTVKEIVSKLETNVAIVNLPYFAKESASDQTFKGVIDVVDKTLIIWSDGDGKAVTVKTLSKIDDDSIKEEIHKARVALIETLCELDEDLMEEFLENDNYLEFPADKLKRSLRKATLQRKVVPVLCGASFKNIGVQPLLDSVVEYLPAPEENPPVKAAYFGVNGSNTRGGRKHSHNSHKSSATGSSKENDVKDVRIGADFNITCALAFKVAHDPIRGTLVYVRVYSGSLQQGATVYNTRTGTKERIGKIVQMQADKMVDVNSTEYGNIGVIVGSKDITTGDTLVAHRTRKDGINSLGKHQLNLHLQPIVVPPPVFSAVIDPVAVSDAKGMEEALEALLKEDPSLKRIYDEENDQVLLAGMGELHLEIAYERLKQLRARVTMGNIMVTYKETISKATKSATVHESWKTGTEISDVTATVSVEPVYEDAQVTEEMFNVHHDNNYIVYPDDAPEDHMFLTRDEIYEAVEIGAMPIFSRGGVLSRLQLHSLCVRVHSVHVSLDSNSTHAVSVAVRKAAEQAMDGLKPGNYSLMEPIMDIKVSVNEEDVGVVSKDLSGNRQGQIVSLWQEHDEQQQREQEDQEDTSKINYKELSEKIYIPEDYTMYLSKHAARKNSLSTVIRASVPLRTSIGYINELRSMTQGRGSFTMDFSHYQPVLPDVSREILENL